MKKILNISEAIERANQLKNQGKTIVLAGGCFDVLHIGHISFLKNAKNQGDFLFLLLESDETIKKLKGENRPINTQKDRATILASLKMIDFVVLLPELKSDNEYDDLIIRLEPNIIAVTKGDPNKFHKERQAKLTNAKLIEVVEKISDQSTTRLAEVISEDF